MAKSTTITKPEPEEAEPTKAVAVVNPEAMAIADFLEGDAQEQGGFSREDVAVPFLRILQSNSPEVKRGDPNQIEGAREGDFLNTATKDVYDGEAGVLVVPVYFTRNYSEWIVRKAGGGLVTDYGADGSIMASTAKDPDTGKDLLPNGHEIVMSGQYYSFVVDAATGLWSPVVLAFSSTQFKKSRRWNTLIDSLVVSHPTTGKRFKPAMFYMSYRCTTVAENNEKGSWMGWQITKGVPVIELPNGAEIYLNARELRESVLRGDVRAAPPEGATTEAAREEGGQQSEGGDEPY